MHPVSGGFHLLLICFGDSCSDSCGVEKRKMGLHSICLISEMVFRYYMMPFIPIGFWSRLLTRLIVFAESKFIEVSRLSLHCGSMCYLSCTFSFIFMGACSCVHCCVCVCVCVVEVMRKRLNEILYLFI